MNTVSVAHNSYLAGISVDNISLGLKRHYPFPAANPGRKYPCRYAVPPVFEEDWSIQQTNAKQPNIDDGILNNGNITVEDLKTMPEAGKNSYRTHAIKEGEGTYGTVYQVIDSSNPTKQLVMKISVANSNFFAEVNALGTLNRKGKTPNVPIIYDWFVTSQLPPDFSYWKSVRASVKNSLQIDESLHDTQRKPYGFIVLEKANSGSLSKFYANHLSSLRPKDTWKVIDSTLFQLLFTAAALPESNIVHRDIGGTNIMLTTVSDRHNNWWFFKVGKQLFRIPVPIVKPILIDYGSAKMLEMNCCLKTDFRFTTLRYRAPEMIFLSISPTGPLQPVFTPSADLFSLGMSMLEMIMGDFTIHKQAKYDNHPFLRYDPPRLLCQKLKDLCQHLRTIECDPTQPLPLRNWYSTLRKGFITMDESSLLARYLWGMCYELGVPSDSTWPGVQQTHIWKILNEVIIDRQANNHRYPTSEGFLFQRYDKLRNYISDEQLKMICSMLRYNPKHRPSPTSLLKSEIFDEYRAVESVLSDCTPCWSIAGACSITW